MRSTYEIENDMEEKFGKDFINKMKKEKEEFDRLSRELEKSKDFETRVNEMATKLSKDFVYISDDLTIHPDEICRNYLSRTAEKIVEDNLNKEEQKELLYKNEVECLNIIEEDANRLLEQIKHKRALWDD